MHGILSWALPLACTVLSYGLAAGFWNGFPFTRDANGLPVPAPITTAQMCVIFVLAKTVTNWGAWLLWGDRRKPLVDPASKDFLRLSLMGQICNGLAWICYFVALGTGPAALVNTITAAYTALAAVLAMLFLKERLAAVQALGVAMVVAAAMILGYAAGGAGSAEGLGWLGASGLCLLFWAVAVIVFKHAYNQPGADDYRFFVVNWVGMVLTMLPYGLLNSRADAWTPDAWLQGGIICLLYCVGDLTLFAAIARGPASIVSPVSGLYPVPTILYSALYLHLVLSGMQWTALAMVLVALVLIVPAPDNPILRILQRQHRQGVPEA